MCDGNGGVGECKCSEGLVNYVGFFMRWVEMCFCGVCGYCLLGWWVSMLVVGIRD